MILYCKRFISFSFSLKLSAYNSRNTRPGKYCASDESPRLTYTVISAVTTNTRLLGSHELCAGLGFYSIEEKMKNDVTIVINMSSKNSKNSVKNIFKIKKTV